MPWKYWKLLENGKTHLFNTTTCEKCGRVVEDVNAVGGIEADIPKYRRGGMTEWMVPLLYEELGYCEKLQMAVCCDCHEE